MKCLCWNAVEFNGISLGLDKVERANLASSGEALVLR